MKGLCWQVHLAGIALATFAGFEYVGRVAHSSRVVEALSKRITHEGSRRNVMTADPPPPLWMSTSSLTPSLIGIQRCMTLVTLHL